MADGYIEFSTKLDNADLEKKLKSAEKSVDRLKRKIEGERDNQSIIEKAMERGEAAIHDTEAEIERLKQRYRELESARMSNPQAFASVKAEMEAITAQIAEQEKTLQKQVKDQDALNEKWQQAQDKVDAYTEKLKSSESNVSELGAQAQAAAAKSQGVFSRAADGIRNGFANAAQSARAHMANAANGAAAPWQSFGKRVNTMLRKVFVFGVILAGLRAIKGAISSMLGENQQFQSSVENLKAVMGGFLSSVVGAVLPALTQFVNMLAAVFERIGGFIDSIFGTDIGGAIAQQRANASAAIQAENAQKLADAQDGQAKSAKRLAKAQKEANRQLLAFDEINALAADTAEDMADSLDGYTPSAGAPELAGDWTLGGFGDFGLFQQVLDWLDMIRHRIETDVEGPFARIREGLALIKQGVGEIVEGFMTGNWALVWQGFCDVVIGALYVVEGALGAFLDWLNETTGYRFNGVFEGAKLAVHGLVEFIEGLLRGDLQLALQGLHDFVDGLAQTIKGIVDAALDFVIELITNIAAESSKRWNEFFDKLEERFPQFKDAIEGLRTFVFMVGDLIFGFITGLVDALRTILGGVVDFAAECVKGLVDVIAGLFSGNTDLLASGARAMLNAVISLFESCIQGLLNGAMDFLNGIIRMANRIPGVSIGYASAPRIRLPRLANGAVIPPNREFLAVLGDQRSGTNIEAPESLIRKIVREEAGAGGEALSVLYELLEAVRDGKVMYVDNQVLGRTVRREMASLSVMGGR